MRAYIHLYDRCLIYQCFRLAKKGDKSVLSFDITGSTPMGRSITVVQHVTVEVVRHADVERLKEPMCPEPDVCSQLHSCMHHYPH